VPAFRIAALPGEGVGQRLPCGRNAHCLACRKRREEREFYLKLVEQQKWSSRQLERQFKLALFERAIATPPKVSAALRQTHPEASRRPISNSTL
jgi:predicted nuclease of restriction endonuclease-like (RecB) superfamily